MRAVGGAAEGLAARLGAARVASSADLLVVELEVFQPLCESQLLLDGHSQQRVESLLLILCRGQLSLHLFQLSDVLVTTAGREGGKKTPVKEGRSRFVTTRWRHCVKDRVDLLELLIIAGFHQPFIHQIKIMSTAFAARFSVQEHFKSNP